MIKFTLLLEIKNQPLFDKNQFPNNLLKMDNDEHRSDNVKGGTDEENSEVDFDFPPSPGMQDRLRENIFCQAH